MDIVPHGNFVLFRNKDEPGVIRAVTEVLSAAGHSVDTFSIGRTTSSSSSSGGVEGELTAMG